MYQYSADDTYSDGSARRMMDLSTNEQALIEYLSAQKKAGVFKSIVVVIASEFQMELGFLDEYDIDACLLTGMTGSYGCEAIAQVLDGTVNPLRPHRGHLRFQLPVRSLRGQRRGGRREHLGQCR